jgi:hypothetical protein
VQHLDGHAVRALAPESWERLWAIVDARDIWRSDRDSTWTRILSLADVSGAADLEALCLADTRANEQGGILVGTRPGHLLRLNAALDAEIIASFDNAPERSRWYTPWGAPADVRTITENDDSVFVNVHVGGVLRSRDEGATWQPTIDIDADVHRVVTGGGRVYAAGAYGLSVSDDCGESWQLHHDGLHARYCRSVAVCGDTVLLSASEGPGGRRAALYRSDLTASHFDRCRDGLPEWFTDNIDSLSLDALPGGELAAAGTDDGEVYATTDRGASWSRVADGLGAIHCILVLP